VIAITFTLMFLATLLGYFSLYIGNGWLVLVCFLVFAVNMAIFLRQYVP
jgi:hypothetical protein